MAPLYRSGDSMVVNIREADDLRLTSDDKPQFKVPVNNKGLYRLGIINRNRRRLHRTFTVLRLSDKRTPEDQNPEDNH